MYIFDMLKFFSGELHEKVRYDTLKFISSLQGLVNRSSPRLYINLIKNSDMYWLDKITDGNGFLQGEEIVVADTFEKLVNAFKDDITGIVLWDEKVPATANLAATICGAEGLIPVRFDEAENSVYKRFVIDGPGFPVKKSLVSMFTGRDKIPGSERTSTGSAKCDAYIWAKEQYLDKGLRNDALMACKVCRRNQ